MLTKRVFILTVSILFLCLTLSCKKKESKKIPQDFVGFWNDAQQFASWGNDGKTIWINEESEGSYVSIQGGSREEAEGSAEVKNDKLRIGLIDFSISQHPEKMGNIGEVWQMTLSGIKYYYNKEYPRGTLVTCGPSLEVWNATSDTLIIVLNGSNRTLEPLTGVSSSSCFGCPIEYTDNLGNNYTYYAIDCYEITIQ